MSTWFYASLFITVWGILAAVIFLTANGMCQQ